MLHSTIAGPLHGAVEKSFGHIPVIDRFKKTEKGRVFVVKTIVIFIENSRDTADATAVGPNTDPGDISPREAG
jgi:hypothetical protein